MERLLEWLGGRTRRGIGSGVFKLHAVGVDVGAFVYTRSGSRRGRLLLFGRCAGRTLRELVVVFASARAGGLRATEGFVAAHHLKRENWGFGGQQVYRESKPAVALERITGETHPTPHTTDQAQTVARCEIVASPSQTATDTLRPAPLSAQGLSRNLKVLQVLNCSAGPGNRRAFLTLAGPSTTAKGGPRSRAGRPAILPELSQFLTDLVSCAGPVVANIVSQLGDMASEIQLVLLQPADVEFLA